MPERDFQLGRMKFVTLLDTIAEDVGAALEIEGAVAAPGARGARGVKLEIPIHGAFDDTDPYEAGLVIRRQARALFNNELAQAYGLYMNWVHDPELNAWIIAGKGEIGYRDGGITLSEFGLTLDDLVVQGKPRTHREARRAEIYDRRLSTTPRDLLGQVYSTNFAGLTPLPVIFLPVGATDVFGPPLPITTVARPAIDGSIPVITAPVHGGIYSYELAEASRNKGDVVLLDRKTFTAPTYTTAGDLDPQTAYGWEEIYGPDQPLTAGDVPVLQNGVCRVRYDSTNTPGFRVDLYDAATSKYVEQGKVYFYRLGDTAGNVDTLVSANVVEWTPERAVVAVVMRRSNDAPSRERMFLVLQRGWTGPRIEDYPAVMADGSPCEGRIWYTVADADTNDAVVKINSGDVATIAATAATGSSLFAGATLDGTAMTGENYLVILREGRAYGVVLAYLQSGLIPYAMGNTSAYGSGASRNTIGQRGVTGWQCVQIGYHAQVSDQTIEAEAIRNTGSGTTSTGSDAGASGGSYVRDTQASEAANTLIKNPTNVVKARYRVLARVRTNGGTGSFRVSFNGAGTTVPDVNTSGNWEWIDLGERSVNALQPLFVNGWRGTATSVDIDRVATVKSEDRTATTPLYDGARDLGSMVLSDARAVPALVTRG